MFKHMRYFDRYVFSRDFFSSKRKKCLKRNHHFHSSARCHINAVSCTHKLGIGLHLHRTAYKGSALHVSTTTKGKMHPWNPNNMIDCRYKSCKMTIPVDMPKMMWGIAKGSTSWWRVTGGQWLVEDGESGFTVDKFPYGLSNPRWSALNVCTY